MLPSFGQTDVVLSHMREGLRPSPTRCVFAASLDGFHNLPMGFSRTW